MKIIVPPIKSQGIKTKLVPWILRAKPEKYSGRYVEPFLGSGVVAFNIKPKTAFLSDSNPHIINFYNAIKNGSIDHKIARSFLVEEGAYLSEHGKDHYYLIRERFNQNHSPLDFLFLSRSCFNGLIRFNSSGGYNVPFGHKPNRFAKAYITKITNQIILVEDVFNNCDVELKCQDFRATLKVLDENDFVYCDPPYVGRHVDYFDSWSDSDELDLFSSLSSSTSKFILSTWHSNKYRKNSFIDTHWSRFNIYTKEHFYHVGGFEKNRNSMIEAFVLNYKPNLRIEQNSRDNEQYELFRKAI